MDTKTLIIHKPEWRCYHGKNSARPVHKRISGRGCPVGLEDGFSSGEAAKRLSLPKTTLETWVRAAKAGKLGDIGRNRRPLTEVEVELAKVKRELTLICMERDILKKAAAYFAKESLPGTR